MPDSEHSDSKYSVTKIPLSVSDDDPDSAPPGEAFSRLSVRENEPDPIFDNADNKIEPELGDPVNQDDIDYEEYLLLGEELQEFGWYRPSLLAAKQELTVRSQIMPWMNNAMCLNAADEVLASIEEPVLQAIMTREGNLNRLVTTDLNVAQTLQQNERHHAHNPKWREEWTHQGARFFIQVDKISTGDYGPINQKRKEVLTTFACALDRIATQAKQAGKLTIPVMHHVGYSISARRRQQLHQSSILTANWLTQFVLAAAKALGFSTHLASHTMLLSRMARAYYFTGGLNSGALACAASVAHMRSDAVTGEQEGEWRVDAEKYMNDNAGYRRRFGREMRRRDALFLEEDDEEEVG
ncbi:hypothetical protein G6514_006207 [Epicoccum nigrum]|nr:hypothetical protein G6514_006207 [Epicoccum nigrum]